MAAALLAVLILLPAVLTYFLRSNAAVAFLALCGGFTVITLSGSEIEQLLGKTKITSLTSSNVDLILLIVPLVLTLFFTVRSVPADKQRFIQVIPALCAGGLLAIVAAPMLNNALNINVADASVWQNLQKAQTYVVGLGLLVSLLLIWTSSLMHKSSHGKKHKK